jgi:hypothetical protein
MRVLKLNEINVLVSGRPIWIQLFLYRTSAGSTDLYQENYDRLQTHQVDAAELID